MSDVSDRELREILDSLTIRELLVIIRLYDLIMQRLRIYALRTQQKQMRSAEGIIEYIVEQLTKSQQRDELRDDLQVDSEKVKQFVEKLRSIMSKEKE